ncbi:CBO0543 family protein [Paenibacillus sp. GCM10012307]|uniref:Uncharacterized protein n=1 Tax=Paenibacillus roseus TaxID=2798579 RepID=A0A934J5W9_9BACL|nr:CBO0543 family protein [Paenibacillus roseus]MBJ6360980.1 hypothetical protein [Paenibacillus roseus]
MKLNLNSIILCGVYAVTLLSLLWIPRGRGREAQFIFLCQGMMTWILGLLAVEFGWIAYPARELQKATHTSFAFEFLVFPVLSIFFTLFYPANKSLLLKGVYTLAFGVGVCIPEVILETYTELVKYNQWRWYWTLFSVMVTLQLCRGIYLWFFRVSPARIGEG